MRKLFQKTEEAGENLGDNLPIGLKMDRFFSKPIYRKGLDSITIIFFLLVIVGPIIYIFSTIFLNIPAIRNDVFADELLGNLQWLNILNSLGYSFSIAATAVGVDMVLAFPISIILTRYNFRGKKILDALVDLPMAVPTSALGFSILLFWGIFGVEPGFSLIIFGHIVFTFPYIVRNMKIVLEKSNTLYEDAARTLGAPGVTIFRTITLPMMKQGIIAGAILAFTRSLGETGATIILSGLIETAPIMIVGFRRQLELPSAAFLAGILISISLILLFSIKFFTRKTGFPIKSVWPRIERFFSHKYFRYFRDIMALAILLIIILVPAF
ncbi:MAG: ABC transporter permease, partial [Candidatus Heimdallarchaeota archaeon]